jgi:hypothetical protein
MVPARRTLRLTVDHNNKFDVLVDTNTNTIIIHMTQVRRTMPSVHTGHPALKLPIVLTNKFEWRSLEDHGGHALDVPISDLNRRATTTESTKNLVRNEAGSDAGNPILAQLPGPRFPVKTESRNRNRLGFKFPRGAPDIA